MQYHNTPSFEIRQGDVVLVDEADHFAFTDPVRFGTLLGHLPTICFTGTSPDAHLNKMEHNVLEKIGLVSYTYWPRCIDAPLKPQISREVKVASDEELIEQLNPLCIDGPVLIFTNVAGAAAIANKIISAVSVTQDTDPDSLRRCNVKTSPVQYSVFVVTDRLVMIGTDFRTPTTGMTLVIDSGLESDREAIQALSRVGRYGERCERIIT